jgi:hypothetical protein
MDPVILTNEEYVGTVSNELHPLGHIVSPYPADDYLIPLF